ncbi:hypothetical protein OA58_04395 [Microcystis aeruginosa NIES-88]|nr:hypothetical protein OA58_04395 [Microcystis aeruginosa NIES-88]BCU12990.1 hypothetical protein MAN88_35540 [Microcystis aeruginosa]
MPFYISVPSLITPVHCITQTEEPDNPSHPSLEFKEVNQEDQIWSIRVGIGWRAQGKNQE